MGNINRDFSESNRYGAKVMRILKRKDRISVPQKQFNANSKESNQLIPASRLLYDNSSPRPPKDFISENSNDAIESFYPSPISVEDSNSHMEEIDLSFNQDDPMPPGIEEDDDDSKRDILILEELIENYSLSLTENDSFRFDIPSFSRPPGKPPDDGFCSLCNSRNSYIYDPNPNSFDCPPDSYHPSHPTYETYSCDSCGNDSNFGYDCQPQFSLNYESKPGYIENYNSYPYDSSSFPQQYLCCENYGVTHESYQCQPKIEEYYHEQNSCYDSNSFGFDQFQPQQFTVNHPIFNVQNDLFDSQNKLIEQLTSMCDMVGQFIQKKEEEKRIEEEQAAKAQNWKLPVCYDDDDDEDEERSNSLKDNIISGLPPCAAITPISLTKEPVDSFKMGDEHLNTIPAMESDEFIKSSVENLVPNPSKSEGENECDVPACFTTFSNILFDADYDFYSINDQSLSDEDFPKEIYSNPLFDEEIIYMKIDPHHFNGESDLIESMLNHDSSIIPSSSKIDSFFDEFAEFVSENSNADIESFSPSPILVEDSDSFMEEIDLSFTPDEPMPPGIKENDDDFERDILILEELLDNYSLSLPENESFCFDIPSSSRPPTKPPDGNTGILNIKMMGDISEQKVPMPRLTITRVSNQEKYADLLSHQG
nr:hypothetical protein [Tanacetum cinerariifolium]